MASATVLDAALYWSLPGPRGFEERVMASIAQTRALVINTPTDSVLALDEHVAQAIRAAGYRLVILHLHEGIDLNGAIGRQLGMRSAPPALLASHVAEERTAILLVAGQHAHASVAEAYTEEFIHSAEVANGNVPLVTSLHDDAISAPEGNAGVERVLTFDGGLNCEEMSAYVALQMICRKGPGSTTLLRSIVREFAGFDAAFAQRLAGLDDGQLLGIREHLRAMMAEGSARWRTGSWLRGCVSRAHDDNHVLYDQYLAEHGTAEARAEAKQRIERRYWRACLRALVPWLEERRLQVVSTFFDQLGSTQTVEVRRGARDIEVDRETLEYNDVVALHRYKGMFGATTRAESEALSICRLAKWVRDEIAHMRSPQLTKVMDLVHGMDSFCR